MTGRMQVKQQEDTMATNTEETGGSGRAYPEDAVAFRAFLAEIGETQGSFVRTLLRLGDHRPKETVTKSIQRMCAGSNKISGEMRVLMQVFRNSRRRRRAAADEAEQAGVDAISV